MKWFKLEEQEKKTMSLQLYFFNLQIGSFICDYFLSLYF